MKKFILKKFAVFLISFFVVFTLMSAWQLRQVFAESTATQSGGGNSGAGTSTRGDSKKIKVLLTEGIGAGKQFWHITRCEKHQAKAPLRCTKTNYHNYPQCQVTLTAEEQQRHDRGEDVLEYKPIFLSGCLTSSGFGRESSEATCKIAGGQWEYQKGEVWAAWFCSEGAQNNPSCPAEKKLKKAVVVLPNGQGENDAKNAVQALYPELGDNFGTEKIWTVGTDDDARVACMEGFFELNDEGSPGNTPKYGDLSSLPTEMGAGCKSYNASSFVKDAVVTCSQGELLEAEGGTGLLTTFIGAIFKWASGIVGIIAVLVMVVSGIQISIAGGDSAKVEEAKTRIMESIMGLAILFLAGLILYTINPNFFTL